MIFGIWEVEGVVLLPFASQVLPQPLALAIGQAGHQALQWPVLLGCLGHVKEGGLHGLVAGVHELKNVSRMRPLVGWHPAPKPGLFLR